MKKVLKRLLQRLFGLHFYLVLHGIFVVVTIRLRFNEGGVMQLIDRLREDCNVVDVGANVGAITVLLSRKCRRGHVYALEPIPQNFRAAQTLLNVFQAGNVRLFDLGLGETEQNVEMVTPALDGVTLSGFSYVITDSRPRSPEGSVYSVRLVPLDAVSGVRHAHIDAIKIDVEGHEQFVLRGAREIISRDRPMIYCELCGTENRKNSLGVLAELGYVPYVATNRRLSLYEGGPAAGINFLCVPGERLNEFAESRAVRLNPKRKSTRGVIFNGVVGHGSGKWRNR